MSDFIPFNRSDLMGKELEHLAAAIASGQVSGDKAFSRRCQDLLESALGSRRVLMTTSCTHALEMAALLLDIKPGDEVIVPSFTFVSTANAFVLRGAKPIFIDSRADTLNLDERLLERLITDRTRAVIPVHYAGVACEMNTITEVAARHGVTVIEDNAHGLFGKYKGRWLGTLGAMATQSFHETKNFSCGEGGALLLNDGSYVERAEIIREKGTDRSRFFRGQVDKYSWVDLGSSYVMSDLLAAFLLAQLDERERIQTHRKRIWQRYRAELADWSKRFGVQLPHLPEDCEPAWHLFHLLLPDGTFREQLAAHLKAANILAVTHYLPLHLSTYAQKWGGKPGDCPVTEDAAERLLRLPLYNSMADDAQSRVIDAVLAFAPRSE